MSNAGTWLAKSDGGMLAISRLPRCTATSSVPCLYRVLLKYGWKMNSSPIFFAKICTSASERGASAVDESENRRVIFSPAACAPGAAAAASSAPLPDRNVRRVHMLFMASPSVYLGARSGERRIEPEPVLGHALADPADRQHAAAERLGRALLGRQEFRRCRDIERPQIVAAEADAGRVRDRHGDDHVDDAVRPVAHDSAAGEERRPDSAVDIHAGTVGSIARPAVVGEDLPVGDATLVEVEVEPPRDMAARVREIQGPVVR